MKLLLGAILAVAVLLNAGGYQVSANTQSPNNNNENDSKLLDMFSAMENRERSRVNMDWDVNNFIDAEPYIRKIKDRLESSQLLAFKNELKQRIASLASIKLASCKTPSGNALDRHCVGRLTGRVMQMIAAVEHLENNPSDVNLFA